MSFQAYLDSVKAKTGKTPDDFRALAAEKVLVKSGQIVAWLKSDYGLGHGHASAVAAVIVHADKRDAGPAEMIAALFSGKKASWRTAYDALAAEVSKFGIVQPSSAARLDIGIKLKGGGAFWPARGCRILEQHGQPSRAHCRPRADRRRGARVAAAGVRRGMTLERHVACSSSPTADGF